LLPPSLKSTIGRTCSLCFTQRESQLAVPCARCRQVWFCDERCRAECCRLYHTEAECSVLLSKPFAALDPAARDLARVAVRVLYTTDMSLLQAAMCRPSEDAADDEEDEALDDVIGMLRQVLPSPKPRELAQLRDVLVRAQCNMFGLYTTRWTEIATMVFARHLQLMNHSCYPNAVFVHTTPDGKDEKGKAPRFHHECQRKKKKKDGQALGSRTWWEKRRFGSGYRRMVLRK
jgi:hypothetical protein